MSKSLKQINTDAKFSICQAYTLVVEYRMCSNFRGIETFTGFADWKLCANILSLQKFGSSSCTVTKMAIERTGIMEKHCGVFALFSNSNFHPQSNKV